MVFDSIEKLKREYTDQYVVVDADRPELKRFAGSVGVVKTINMNGRALVEFQEYHANIGWFDIALDFLKVVPKPAADAAGKVEKPAAKKAEAKKPEATKPVDSKAGEKKLSPLELARMQGAAKPAGAAPAKAAAKPAPAGAKSAAEKPAVKPGGKLSTADILAAARSKKAAEASDAPPAEAPEPSSVAMEQATQPEPAPEPKPMGNGATVSAKPTTTAEKIALCRQIDANRKAATA